VASISSSLFIVWSRKSSFVSLGCKALPKRVWQSRSQSVTTKTTVPLIVSHRMLILDGAPRRVTMKKLLGIAALLCITAPAFAPFSYAQTSNPKIYIAPQNGFESYLAGAFTKKNVPAQMVQSPEEADYILSPAPVEQKPESTGGKIARCLFAYCAGIEGSQTASVTLTDAKTNAVVWAYNVRKGGSSNFQSSAEACAKHLKNWLQHTGK
jgi:hypothetical protein